MSPIRRFKKEYAIELLKIAHDDLETARTLSTARIQRKENILFHVQQTIEKALKATLCAQEKDIPLVHELKELVNQIEGYRAIPGYDIIYDLTQFATIRRYEDGVAIITQEEVELSINLAESILLWVSGELKRLGL